MSLKTRWNERRRRSKRRLRADLDQLRASVTAKKTRRLTDDEILAARRLKRKAERANADS